LTTFLLEKNLRINFDQNIQVLNISAPSWGPDNVMAYLKKFGDFDAEILFLVTSSHDVYDTMEFIPIVGINKNYPEKQYSLAYIEGVDRYLIPWLGKNLKGNKNISGGFEDEDIKAERN